MWTSTVRDVPYQWASQTSARMSCRVTIAPGSTASSASRSNSFGVSDELLTREVHAVLAPVDLERADLLGAAEHRGPRQSAASRRGSVPRARGPRTA